MRTPYSLNNYGLASQWLPPKATRATRQRRKEQTKNTRMKTLTVHTPLRGALAAVLLIGHAVIAGPIPLNARLELRRTLQFSGRAAGAVAWHQGQLWIADPSGVLRRIDPETGEVQETRSTGLSTHVGLGSDGGVLFMSYDPGGNTLVQAVIPAGPSFVTPTSGARDLTAQGGGLWYADFDDGKLVKMSTHGQLLAQFASPVGFGAAGIEWDGAHLLHTGHDGNILYFIDPTDGSVDGQIDLSEFNPTIAGGLAWNGEELFAADDEEVYVFAVVGGPIPLDAKLELHRTLQFAGGEAAAVAWHQGQLWIADPSGVLRRIDATNGTVLQTQPTGLSTHVGLGSYGGILYMSCDPGGNTLVQPVIPPGASFLTPTSGARDLTGEGGGIWYADFDEGKIVKMTTNSQLLAQFASPVGFGAAGIEWDGAHLLHTGHDGNILYFIDPTDGSVDGQIDLSAYNPTIAGGIAWNGQELFAADFQRLYVFRIRPPVTMTVRVSQVEVCWNSRTNKTYQVQYRSNLTMHLWTDLGAALPGTGATRCVLDAVLGQERRFYRVVETP
jgi:sugar lactone lactonase YvrE